MKPQPDACPFDLDRFVAAQRAFYDAALVELRNGRKRSHWMWFVFPQVAGLGSSSMAVRYAIKSRAEAVAYLEHPILGSRLTECAEALLRIQGKTAEEVMGYPDHLKLKSSMTLFAAISDAGSPFQQVLGRYYAGDRDAVTIAYLTTHT